MTQSARAGVNINKAFTKKVGSRLLFYKSEHLSIQAHNKSSPQARFSRVNLGQGAFVWCPTNKAGEEHLSALSEVERNKFLYHVPTPDTNEPKPESRRVVDGSPIKGLPNGHREADYFPSERSPRAYSGSSKSSKRESGVTIEPSDEEIQRIREMISAGTFGK